MFQIVMWRHYAHIKNKQLKVHIAAEDTVQAHMLEEVKVMVHVLGGNSGDGLSGDGSYCWT